MAVSIQVEKANQSEMVDLIAALNDYLLTQSPPEYCFHMSVDEMDADDTKVFVARDCFSGIAVGCCALRLIGDGMGEVKRMYVDPSMRGQQIGVGLLVGIEDAAKSQGLDRLVLETGSKSSAATTLYKNFGFRECSVFLDYPDSEHNIFLEKHLND